jgi:cation diffusion facilitator CzcD-associated flavoprotein CzcO
MTQPLNPDHNALDTLRLVGPAPDNWVPDRAGVDHNVLIVGAGQTGAAFAFALRRAGIGRVSVIDAAQDESKAGVWLTRARMNKLRTPKSLVGPETSFPGLSFQAWYEARFGGESYAAIDRIPRTRWAEYLKWYRDFLGIAIRYGTRLTRIEPADGLFRVHLEVSDGVKVQRVIETTRKVILANGVAGNGGPYVPDVLKHLPQAFHAHTSGDIDFARCAGNPWLCSVVLHLHLMRRRQHSKRVQVRCICSCGVPRCRRYPSRGPALYPGAYDNYYQLPDAIRWGQARRFRRSGSTPPADAVERVTNFANFYLHLGAQWSEARIANDAIEAHVADERLTFDFAIAGTGYFIDPAARPELADFARHIRLWRDQYVPPSDDADDYLGAHPYLGAALEYLERTGGDAPYLRDIHVYNPAGFVSFGLPVGDVPSMRRDIPAVVQRIGRDLFLADLDAHVARMNGDVPADFDASLYANRLWQGARADVA